jgi:hypothetical protein
VGRQGLEPWTQTLSIRNNKTFYETNQRATNGRQIANKLPMSRCNSRCQQGDEGLVPALPFFTHELEIYN